MNSDPTSPFAFVQSIFMIVFVLMLFVGVAGGTPETVLKPFMEIVSTLLGALLSLAVAVLRGILSLLLSSLHALLSFWKSSSSRHINR